MSLFKENIFNLEKQRKWVTFSYLKGNSSDKSYNIYCINNLVKTLYPIIASLKLFMKIKSKYTSKINQLLVSSQVEIK